MASGAGFIHSIYWEAELPPNYDRVGIENFIRAKYEEKRWVSNDGKPKSPSREQEEQASTQQGPAYRSGYGYARNSENFLDERKKYQAPTTKDSIPATRISIPVPPKRPEPVAPAPMPQQVIQKSEPAVPPGESVKQVFEAVSAPKIDFATDLFNMLSTDDPTESGSEAPSADDDVWAGFQCASTTEKITSTEPVHNKTRSASGIEDLFQDLPSISFPSEQEKPNKDVKIDIMSLFEKSNMVSPFAIHQQQLAMLAQQQSFLMAAAKSAAGVPKFPGNVQQSGSNAANVPSQNWHVGYQIPGMMMSVAGKSDLEKVTQLGNMGATFPLGNFVPSPASSIYAMGQNDSGNGVAPSGMTKPQSASPVAYASSTQTGKDFDFSSLTRGMFSKSILEEVFYSCTGGCKLLVQESGRILFYFILISGLVASIVPNQCMWNNKLGFDYSSWNFFFPSRL